MAHIPPSIRLSNNNGRPEIFSTIQGEGLHTGEPATFVRTSNCNLQCVWCDTPYTWNWEGTKFEHEEGIKYSKENEQTIIRIGEAVDLITNEKAKRVVVSGGEPMLQQGALIDLCRELNWRGDYKVDIETNGTIVLSPELEKLLDTITVSPKLSNSGMDKKKRYRPKALESYVKSEKANFKFVVDTPQDLLEIEELVRVHNIKGERVWLMPEGRTKEEIQSKMPALAELAKEYNFNLTSRLHIELWGERRGV